MRRYITYLSYVLRHKWFVFLECCKLGVPWLGLIHDWSKFRPDEFVPYARHFHLPDGSKRPKQRDKTGYYKPTDTGDSDFDYAWFLHQKRNKHHWQYWTQPEDGGGLKILPIPKQYAKEMLADWRGAGKAQGTPNTSVWYHNNSHKLCLDEGTRDWIEEMLNQ